MIIVDFPLTTLIIIGYIEVAINYVKWDMRK